MPGEPAIARGGQGATDMAENETLDLWDGRRWRKLFGKIESDRPAEEIVEEGERCLVSIFKTIVQLLPLGELLDAASRGDSVGVHDIVRRCYKAHEHAELLAQQAALYTDPERILEGFALAVMDGILDQFEMKLSEDGRWPEMVSFRTKRESLCEQMRECAARLGRKVADRPNEKPRMPRRSADQKEIDQRDLQKQSLLPRSGTHG